MPRIMESVMGTIAQSIAPTRVYFVGQGEKMIISDGSFSKGHGVTQDFYILVR